MIGRKSFLAWAILIGIGAMCLLPEAYAEKAPSEGNTAAATVPTATGKSIEAVDWLVIGGYFAILFVLARWVIKKSKDTSDDYFLAGRGLGWFIVGASIFASNIGSEHLVGLAGSGATDGVAMAHYELHAWCLLVLAWVMVPFYARSKVFTMPQFLERRFSPGARWVLSIISLVAYVVTKIAVGIFAGGIVFSVLLPEINVDLGFMTLDSFWVGSILVLVFTGVYTTLGGLRAVAYTEALQTLVLIVGSALVTYFGLQAIGGWDQLKTVIGSDMFNLWKPLVPEGVQGTWSPVEVKEGGEIVKQAWYFNVLRPDHRAVVLVHRPVHRAAGPGCVERDRGPTRQHLRLFPEAAAGVHLHHPRHDLLRVDDPGQTRRTARGRQLRRHVQEPGCRGGRSRYGNGRRNPRTAEQEAQGHRPGRPRQGLPVDGPRGPPARRARHRGRRAAGRADEFAGRRPNTSSSGSAESPRPSWC